MNVKRVIYSIEYKTIMLINAVLVSIVSVHTLNFLREKAAVMFAICLDF